MRSKVWRSLTLTINLILALVLPFTFNSPGDGIALADSGSSSPKVQIDIQAGFQPANVTISPGTLIEWRNKEKSPHTVTSDTSLFDSGVLPDGGRYGFTFTNPGTYSYSDKYSSYKGIVRVTGAAPAPPPVTPPAPGPTPSPGSGSVQIGDNFFTPGAYSIAAGTTVTWTNNGQRPHSVTSDTGVFNSGVVNPGQTFSFTFTNSGTFSYHCIFHSGQTGSVTVTGGSPAPNPTPNPTPTPAPTPNPNPSPTPAPGGSSIQIGDNNYTPVSLTTTAGASITWTNVGQAPHSVTSDTGLFNSNVLMPGQSYSFTFTNSGTFSYHCMFHSGQTGSVTVTGGSTTSNSGLSSTGNLPLVSGPTLTALEIVTPFTPNVAALSLNPRIDNNVIPFGLPANSLVFDVITGNVTGISPDRLEWRIGTQPVFIYTSSSTRMVGNPAVGDSIEVLAYRTLNPGPLVADRIATSPGRATGPAVVTQNYQLTGKVTTPTQHTWTIGGTKFIIEGDPPANISPGLSGLVTVQFAATGIFLPAPIIPAPSLSPPPASAGSTIQVKDNNYTPSTFTIPVGATITWINEGQLPHTATSDTGLFDSGMLMPGQSFSFTLPNAGNFSYHCTFHSGQIGSITVTGGITTSTGPTSSSPAISTTSLSPVTTPTPVTTTTAVIVTTPVPTPSPAAVTTTPDSSGAVGIGDNSYTPDVLTLLEGTTVTWTNNGKLPHTVTSSTGLFDSGVLMPGQSFSYTFPGAGDFGYRCILHSGQIGGITVKSKGGAPTTLIPSASTSSSTAVTPDPAAVTPPASAATPQPTTSPGPQTSPETGSNVVRIGDNTYTPSILTMSGDGNVTWTNYGQLPHTVTSKTSLFDSGILMPGQSFSFTFSSAGDFSYHCVFHPEQAGAVTVSFGNLTAAGTSVSSAPIAPSPVPDATPEPPTLPQPVPDPVPAPTPASPMLVTGSSAVRIGDINYTPDGLTITEGEAVTWTNDGQLPHTVTSNAGHFGSIVLMPGQSFTYTFSGAGDFSYRCILHPGQNGTITVVGSSISSAITTSLAKVSAATVSTSSSEHLSRDYTRVRQDKAPESAVFEDSPGQSSQAARQEPASRLDSFFFLVGIVAASTFSVSFVGLLFFVRRKHR